MTQYLLYGGGPFGIGSGYVQLDNQSITQSLYLEGVNAIGIANTKIRLRFAGNGVDSYRIQKATLEAGAIVVPITVNGATSFSVPRAGIWSDVAATTSFTLPGSVNLVAIAKLNVPMLYPVDSAGAQTGVSAARVALGVEQSIATETEYVVLNYEGIEGSTTFVDEAQGLTGSYSANIAITTSKQYSGASCLKFQGTAHDFGYTNIPGLAAVSSFVFSCFYKHSDVFRENTEYLEINLYDHNSNSTYIELRIWGPTATDGPAGTIVTKVYNNQNVQVLDDSTSYSIPASDVWQKLEIKVVGNTITVLLNDTAVSSSTSGTISGIDCFWIYSNVVAHTNTMFTYFDSIRIDRTGQPNRKIETLDTVSSFTITVTDNSLIEVADTITIAKSLGSDVYSFAEHRADSPDDIVIGVDAATTAQNIAGAINRTYGAEYVATAINNAVTVIRHTDDSATTSKSCDGITVGSAVMSALYLPKSLYSAFPSFTGYGTALDHGDLGDNYGLSSVPRFSGSGSGTNVDNVASSFVPAFTGWGYSHAAYEVVAADTFGVADTQSLGFGHLAADGLLAYDMSSMGWHLLVPETFGAAESLYEIIGKLVDEYLLFTETMTPLAKTQHVISDVLFAYDEATHERYYVLLIEDTFGFEELFTELFGHSINESLVISDLQVLGVGKSFVVVETINVGDDNVFDRYFIHLIEDAIDATDESTSDRYFFNIINDTLYSVDASALLRECMIVLNETILATDDASDRKYYLMLADDDIGVADESTGIIQSNLVANSSLGFGEHAVVVAAFSGLAIESLVLNDVNAYILALNIEEGLNFEDAQITKWEFMELVDDNSLGISESFD